MDGNTIPISENTTVIVKSSGDLFLRGEEQSEVRFWDSEDRIRVNQSNDNLYVETRASMDLDVPRNARVIVEKVGGSAFLQDLGGALVVQKVGGDLSMQRVGNARVEKVGGDCMIEGVNETLVMNKVGGDLTIRQANGAVTIESAGGDLDVQTTGAGPMECRTGGDLRLYITEAIEGNKILRAGGDIHIYLPANASGRFAMNSSGENISLNLSRQETPLVSNEEKRRYEFTLGSGAAVTEAYAGGDISVSDEQVEPEPITGELERLENAWIDARGRSGSPSWSAGFGFDRSSAWADMVSRRAQEAARRAEQRAQSSMRRTEEQIRQAAERQVRQAMERGPYGMPFGAPPTPPPPQPSSPVSEQERLMVLKMLQENKITVEQAEKLLAALEGRFKE